MAELNPLVLQQLSNLIGPEVWGAELPPPSEESIPEPEPRKAKAPTTESVFRKSETAAHVTANIKAYVDEFDIDAYLDTLGFVNEDDKQSARTLLRSVKKAIELGAGTAKRNHASVKIIAGGDPQGPANDALKLLADAADDAMRSVHHSALALNQLTGKQIYRRGQA